MSKTTAAARLASSHLLGYPDDALYARLDELQAVVGELPESTRGPLGEFIGYLHGTTPLEAQQHFVSIFDMKRKACPYLTYWTDGDTRNRGRAILHFKQAYLDAGFALSSDEMADHLSVVLEFAAIGDRAVGEALLAEHSGPITLLRDALAKLESPYALVLDAVVATLPALTPAVRARMAELAAGGPPVETVGLEPYGVSPLQEPMGARR